jgi:hypothetical protein
MLLMSKSKRGDYEVGYGRPPQHSQFKKGESGNPKGRRRGAKSLLDLLLKALDEKVTIKESGSSRKISKRGALMKQLVNRALSGDDKAFRLIFEAIGPRSDRGQQEEREASHRESEGARERIARKLEQMHERIRAGLPPLPEEAEEPEAPKKAASPRKW